MMRLSWIVSGFAIPRDVSFQEQRTWWMLIMIICFISKNLLWECIDLLWWRNTKRIRFSCAPDKSLYQDPKKHIGSFVRGAVMYVIVAVIPAGILMLY